MKRSRYSDRHKRRMIRAVEKGAKAVSTRMLDYDLGGGRDYAHNRMFKPPMSGDWHDCSGYASWLLQQAEDAGHVTLLKNGCGSTITLAEEGEHGDSAWLTLFIKNPPGEVDNEHVIIRLRRKWLVSRKIFGEHRWVECGGSDNPHIGDGPAFFHPTKARIEEFPIHRHFKEL